ncbi:MAG: hypothetical protein J7M03_02030, partial [Candidatus Desulfofervidaceae bacterium]|nr:hypothetical protein [Candidatus Desulfofervidaceae bacterium]
FIQDKALAFFEEIESKVSKRCIIQGRDFDRIDYQSTFKQCSHVIHHGGCGTTHIALNSGVEKPVYPLNGESLFYSRSSANRGVKQIIYPLHGENLYWAYQAEKFGFGFNAFQQSIDNIVKYIEVE